jgi:activator of HSP90 ATPase
MCKTIKQKVKFAAPARVVYELLADSKKHSAFSGAAAKVSRKVGGAFFAYSGYIGGINVDLVPGKRLVQAWRTTSFPAGIFSMAAFTLSATRDGGTEVVLVHRGVPKELISKIEAEWRKFYWAKMKRFLSER